MLGRTCDYNFISCKALVPIQNDKESEAKLNIMTCKKYDLTMHGKYIHYAEQKHNGNKLTCSHSSMVKPSARCIWWSRTLKSLTRISTGTKCRSFFARIDIISFISILRSERGTANHSASSRSSLRISALPQKSSNNSQKFPMVASEQRYGAKSSHIYYIPKKWENNWRQY